MWKETQFYVVHNKKENKLNELQQEITIQE